MQPNGTQQVTPTESTTYTLTAKGAGGTQTATATSDGKCSAATSAAASAVYDDGRAAVRPEREGRLFRLRQVGPSRRSAVHASRRMRRSCSSTPT